MAPILLRSNLQGGMDLGNQGMVSRFYGGCRKGRQIKLRGERLLKATIPDHHHIGPHHIRQLTGREDVISGEGVGGGGGVGGRGR